MKLYISFFTSILFTVFASNAQQVYLFKDSTGMPNYSMDEIMVTSMKEPVGVENMPIPATSLKGRLLENGEINSLQGISAMVPNFFMPDYGSKLTSPVYIRGIGTRIGSPSVGLYVDNIPYFEKAVFDFDFFDLERVEVLRGPQGTLYGRNTMGGIINVYTPSALKQQKTTLAVTGGNYQQVSGQIGHSQRLGKSLGISVNALYKENGGFYQNAFTDQAVDESEIASGRIKLEFAPGRKIKAGYVAHYEHSRQGGYPYAVYDDSLQLANEIRYDHYSLYNRDMLANSLYAEYDFGLFRLRSTTSHQYFDDWQNIDQDFTPATLLVVQQDQKQHVLSQELIAKSNTRGNHEWLTGAFAFWQGIDRKVNVQYGPDAVSAFRLPGEMAKDKYYDLSTSGLAVFHQSTLKHFILDGLTLTGGIRLDYEMSKMDYAYYRELNQQTTRLDSFINILKFTEVLPKVSLHYKWDKGLETYFSFATGYKTGGFNTTIERDEDKTYLPETSNNYELGVKDKYFDEHLIMNVNLYYIDWYDQQIYQPVPSGQGSMLKNAGRSRSQGVELETTLLPFQGACFQLAYGYTDAKFLKYQRNDTTSYGGNRLPYIPRHTLHASGDYTLYWQNSWLEETRFHLGYRVLGKHYWNEENTSYQEPYGLLNAKIAFKKKWLSLEFWGKNINGQEYHSFFFQALGNSYVQIGKPARFGLNVKVEF